MVNSWEEHCTLNILSFRIQNMWISTFGIVCDYLHDDIRRMYFVCIEWNRSWGILGIQNHKNDIKIILFSLCLTFAHSRFSILFSLTWYFGMNLLLLFSFVPWALFNFITDFQLCCNFITYYYYIYTVFESPHYVYVRCAYSKDCHYHYQGSFDSITVYRFAFIFFHCSNWNICTEYEYRNVLFCFLLLH